MTETTHGNCLYPWQDWCDGKWREKVQGKHFDGDPEGFRKQVIRAAKKHGMKATTRVIGKVVRFCITTQENESKSKKGNQ